MPSIQELLKSRQGLQNVEAAKRAATARSLGPYGIWSWMYDRFGELPRRSLSRAAHDKLWNGGLTFESTSTKPATVGDLTSRLLAAGFQQRRNVLVLLPASSAQEPYMLPSLIVAWYLEAKALKGKNRILCVSGRSGVQRYLRKAVVGGLNLSDVLTLEVDSRSKQAGSVQTDADLPYVVCACRPAEPAKLLSSLQPDLVLLDLCDCDDGSWIGAFLKAATATHCAICVWTNNPWVFAASEFSIDWLRFRWSAFPPPNAADDPLSLRELVLEDRDIEFEAIQVPIIDGSAVQALSRANLELIRAKPTVRSAVAAAGYRLVARYIRTMTRLPVPVPYYEAKCRDQWGMRSIASLGQSLDQFFMHWPEAPEAMHAAVYWAKDAAAKLPAQCPPLAQFAVESFIDGRFPGIAFPSQSLADAFKEFAAAEYYVDLNDSRLPWLGVAGRSPGMPGEVLHVGIPSTLSLGRNSALLMADRIAVAHYPFERPLLHYVVTEVQRIWPVQLSELTSCLAQLAGKDEPPTPDTAYPRIKLAEEPIEVDLDQTSTAAIDLESLVPKDIWTSLLREDDVEPGFGSEEAVNGAVWVTRVVQVNFIDGRCIRLSQEGQVQSARNGRFQEVDAVDLEPGDEMLVVDGARRQDLYSLILDRLHSGTTVATFVDLMDRWRSEIATHYRTVWRARGGTFTSLLAAIQRDGSRITTEQTVRAWVLGWHLPQDRMDIKRVATFLQMPFASKQYTSIAWAGTQLANVHRATSRQINNWLEVRITNPARARAAMNAEVDSSLGVSLRDFYDAVVVLEVESVQVLEGGMPSSVLGQLVSRKE